jgi:hypothetical protein
MNNQNKKKEQKRRIRRIRNESCFLKEEVEARRRSYDQIRLNKRAFGKFIVYLMGALIVFTYMYEVFFK